MRRCWPAAAAWSESTASATTTRGRCKEANLARLRESSDFRLVEADLAESSLTGLLDGADTVFHLAAQPGVRQSFGDGFRGYLHHNVRGTQRLLEAASGADIGAFVYASSSSVYGDQDVYPAREDAPVRPVSPYGATKVITEQLANAFWRSHGVPATGLRYFTVYGPRQRPDMAFSRFMERALDGRPLTILGDGRQVREFTYVGDVISATIAAATRGERGSVYNVGGGQPVALLDVIALLERLLGAPLLLEHVEAGPGDPRRTEADVSRAARDLGYRPETALEDGLAAQLESLEERMSGGIIAGPSARRAGRRAAQAAAGPSRVGTVSGPSPRRPAPDGPLVLAYSHDGYGLGHLRRNLRVLKGLGRERPDVRAVLVTGARSAERIVAPFGMTCVSLPSVVKVANGSYVVDGRPGSFEQVLRQRSGALAEAVDVHRPDLLLVDRYPRGMQGELEAALEIYAEECPGSPAVLGLRDILDSRAVIRREWEEHGHNQTIRDTYRMVLCYGDRAVYDPIREYGLPDDVGERLRFTGYLADELLAADALEVRCRHQPEDGRLALCTVGGGKDAVPIAQAFVAAMGQLCRDGWSGVLITGPYMAEEDVRRLRRSRRGGVGPPDGRRRAELPRGRGRGRLHGRLQHDLRGAGPCGAGRNRPPGRAATGAADARRAAERPRARAADVPARRLARRARGEPVASSPLSRASSWLRGSARSLTAAWRPRHDTSPSCFPPRAPSRRRAPASATSTPRTWPMRPASAADGPPHGAGGSSGPGADAASRPDRLEPRAAAPGTGRPPVDDRGPARRGRLGRARARRLLDRRLL